MDFSKILRKPLKERKPLRVELADKLLSTANPRPAAGVVAPGDGGWRRPLSGCTYLRKLLPARRRRRRRQRNSATISQNPLTLKRS